MPIIKVYKIVKRTPVKSVLNLYVYVFNSI